MDVPAGEASALTLERMRAGRAVMAHPDGTFYVARHYTVYASPDEGRTWSRLLSVPRSTVRRCAEVSRLACRLMRHEIRAVLRLSDGTWVASNREGVYVAPVGEAALRPSRVQGADWPARPPMTLTLGPQDRVLWGEYWGNRERRPVRVYVSADRGRSFEVAHVFRAGEVKHVHNLLYDPRMQVYWILVGDHGDEPGIGRLSADLRTFEWLVRGKQEYRAVWAFDAGDCLVYGTDTEMARNAIIRLHKHTGRMERLTELEGSCIYACRFGGLYALTTSVEPSRVNATRDAALWVSRDAERWVRVFSAAKDRWSARYFQFGSLVLPAGAGASETILFSGQALVGLDGRAVVARLADAPAQ